ncbi:MAG TPA: CaiB/BaiF CoA-transferase family protein, partial [Hyphomicrobiaceae bacterium]|nr:CaiB/BaiF CoA-transferase family protein [Hyphomicrobiaceae bacterium]
KAGGLAAYGLAYDQLAATHARLVYCSISGFGQTGPNAHRAGYDILAQGYGGIMSLTGEPDGEPVKVGVGIADVMCGMYASTAILAALRHRDATGEGQHIDLALVDAQIAWLINEGTNYLMSGQLPARRGNQHPNIVPYQVFESRDGHVIVAVGNDQQFARFCRVIGAPGLADDPDYKTNENRLRHREALVPLVAARVAGMGKRDLLAAMEENGIPGGPINTLDEVFSSDQVAARGMRISMPHPRSGSGQVDLIGNPLKLSRTPVAYRHAPPECGADTDTVIRELLGEDALAAARASGCLE